MPLRGLTRIASRLSSCRDFAPERFERQAAKGQSRGIILNSADGIVRRIHKPQMHTYLPRRCASTAGKHGFGVARFARPPGEPLASCKGLVSAIQ